jgi:RNA polymerase sigma-70 factor (ECF subfamily)
MTDTGPAARAGRWVEEHGDYLYRFAMSRLGRADLAEDAVQETFLAALRASETFAGLSSERTWLAGILRNKVVDQVRRAGKALLASELEATGEWADGLFDRWDHWKRPPGPWGDGPAGEAERAEF